MQTVSLIAAIGRNRVIGAGPNIPWRLPADQQRFKRLTMGRPLIMGRKTHESIGRPLPGRRNIVVSRRPGYEAPGCEVAGSFPAALATAGEGEVFVIGGAELYREALLIADRLYLTLVDLAPDGDVRFPAYNAADWVEVERIAGIVNERNAHRHTFVTLARATPRRAALLTDG
jgi:dihydrofolate reductase